MSRQLPSGLKIVLEYICNDNFIETLNNISSRSGIREMVSIMDEVREKGLSLDIDKIRLLMQVKVSMYARNVLSGDISHGLKIVKGLMDISEKLQLHILLWDLRNECYEAYYQNPSDTLIKLCFCLGFDKDALKNTRKEVRMKRTQL
ncbi:MAG: hypothetical protein Q8Q33_05070 [Chlamydiota bacterium]|nr:hypothetical protein [Chlamydiota bacterium]